MDVGVALVEQYSPTNIFPSAEGTRVHSLPGKY